MTSRGGATEEVAGGAAVLVDPLDAAAIADGIAEAESRRDELVPLGLERARKFTWERGGRRSRGTLAGAGMSAPLVVVDADVLGRRRTGDETYVLNLLRELPPLAAAARPADRRGDAPAGSRPGRGRGDRAAMPSQALRMAWALPRLLRTSALPSSTRSTPSRCAAPARPSSRSTTSRSSVTRPRWDGGTGPCSGVSCRGPPGARAHVLTVSERSKRDILELYGLAPDAVTVTPNGVDPVFRPGAPGSRDYVLAVGAVQQRKHQLAALEAAQEVGLPLVVVGPEKDARTASELRRRGATLRGYVADGRARRRCIAGRLASCRRRATRDSDCRCSRRWRAARRW